MFVFVLLTLGVILYITIIHILLYYYYILYIIHIHILLLYIISYTILFLSSPHLFYLLFLLFCSPLSFPSSSPILPSFYTCRYLHMVIYIQSISHQHSSSFPLLFFSSSIPNPSTIRPRTIYRSGWLRCVGLIGMVFCSGF